MLLYSFNYGVGAYVAVATATSSPSHSLVAGGGNDMPLEVTVSTGEDLDAGAEGYSKCMYISTTSGYIDQVFV